MVGNGKGKGRTFAQDLMRKEYTVGDASKRKKRAIPGGGLGQRSVYQFKTEDGFETGLKAQAEGTGTSVFDPVLCELVYRWFCPPGGRILDPFAGGSVRGIVASKLGRPYYGIELRAEQVLANQSQASLICDDPMPEWIVGDSNVILDGAIGHADLVFTCPPYADLEEYSDDPADISNMPHEQFLAIYKEIIRKAALRLKQDRFFAVVIGDARDKQGFFYGLPARTVQFAWEAGLHLYNEAILVTAVGSLPVRVRRQFEANRKLGKTHQTVLIFVKGSPKIATDAIGKVDFGEGDPLADSDSDFGGVGGNMA